MRSSDALQSLPVQIQAALDRAGELEQLAEEFKETRNFLYLGRGYNFPAALEGALKLKEISYIHAEGYPAAEMKHGPIALIDEMMPVVFVAPHDSVFDKVASNVQEVKARNGMVIAITSRAEPSLEGKIDHEIRIPETIAMLSPILAAVPMQLLAYYIAVKRGANDRSGRGISQNPLRWSKRRPDSGCRDWRIESVIDRAAGALTPTPPPGPALAPRAAARLHRSALPRSLG